NVEPRTLNFDRDVHGVCRAVYAVEAQHHADWTDHTVTIVAETVEASDGGPHEPFVMEILGPLLLPDVVDEIELVAIGGAPDVNGRSYGLTMHDERIVLADPKHGTPAAMLTVPSTDGAGLLETLEEGTVEDIFEFWVDFGLSYYKGFAKGLWDTGADLVDTAGLIVKFGVHYAKHYQPLPMAIRFVRSGEFLIEEDQRKYELAKETAAIIGQRVHDVLLDNTDVIVALLVQSDPFVSTLGAAMPYVANTIIEILESIRADLLEIEGSELGHGAGWIMGRIVGEAVVEVLAAIGTAGTANVGLRVVRVIGTIHRVQTRCNSIALKVPDIPGISPELMHTIVAKLEELIEKVAQVLTIRQCFPAGTLVQAAMGLTPIELIQPGDFVLARHVDTGALVSQPVTRVWQREADALVDVVYAIESSGETAREGRLTTTVEHPFYVEECACFVPAASLDAGMTLVSAIEGHAVHVKRIDAHVRADHAASTRVYNLEVEGPHTYFAGADQLWVHNTCGDPFANAFAVVEKLLPTSPSHFDAFQTALEKTSVGAARRRFDAGLPELCDALMVAMYREAQDVDGFVDLAKLKSAGELKAFRGTTAGARLLGKDLDIHHIVPQQWARAFYKMNHGVEPPAGWLDEMPGLIVNRHLHQHASPGTASFHNIARQRINEAVSEMADLNDIDEAREALMEALHTAYVQWDPEYGPLYSAAARQWLESNGL
ncbi:MAG: polymorphic toxin-type HINT domain-containing protein, partial [Planctomycetota bacterium]